MGGNYIEKSKWSQQYSDDDASIAVHFSIRTAAVGSKETITHLLIVVRQYVPSLADSSAAFPAPFDVVMVCRQSIVSIGADDVQVSVAAVVVVVVQQPRALEVAG